jgi:hypothetical protein
MGFGLLLIGYIFAFTAAIGLGPYYFAGMVLGGFLMYLGITELKKYSPVFIYAYVLNIALLLCAFIETVTWAETQFVLGLGLESGFIATAMNYIKFAVGLLFNIALLYGIADLSRRVDFPETRTKAFRNMIFVGVFYAYQLIMLLPIANDILMSFLPILQFIYALINTFLIFKCYAMICPASDVDMPRKPSRFAFVNKMRAAADEREERAIEEAKKYYESKKKKKKKK